jgi:hypothetical protein
MEGKRIRERKCTKREVESERGRNWKEGGKRDDDWRTERSHINNNSGDSKNWTTFFLLTVNISLLVFICPSVHVSMYSTARLVLDRYSWNLVLGYVIKIVSIFGFLQKSENYITLVDTYVNLLRYLTVTDFIIYRDFVLYEVGAEHLNWTMKHDWYRASSLKTYWLI